MMTSPAMTKNGHMTRRGAPPRAVIGMITDKTTHALLTQIATQRGIPFAFGIGCIEEALADLASDETADCVIVEIVDNSAAIDDVAILASQLPPRTELILIGAFTELEKSDLALAGASLCIEKPPSEAMLESIFGLPLRPPAAIVWRSSAPTARARAPSSVSSWAWYARRPGGWRCSGIPRAGASGPETANCGASTPSAKRKPVPPVQAVGSR